jgi:hypothetical protein
MAASARASDQEAIASLKTSRPESLSRFDPTADNAYSYLSFRRSIKIQNQNQRNLIDLR